MESSHRATTSQEIELAARIVPNQESPFSPFLQPEMVHADKSQDGIDGILGNGAFVGKAESPEVEKRGGRGVEGSSRLRPDFLGTEETADEQAVKGQVFPRVEAGKQGSLVVAAQ